MAVSMSSSFRRSVRRPWNETVGGAMRTKQDFSWTEWADLSEGWIEYRINSRVLHPMTGLSWIQGGPHRIYLPVHVHDSEDLQVGVILHSTPDGRGGLSLGRHQNRVKSPNRRYALGLRRLISPRFFC